jgi:hypothetical protein
VKVLLFPENITWLGNTIRSTEKITRTVDAVRKEKVLALRRGLQLQQNVFRNYPVIVHLHRGHVIM